MQAQSSLRSPSAKAGVEGRKALEGIDGFAGGQSIDRAQTATWGRRMQQLRCERQIKGNG